MPTIRREDGSQFVIQPYRELYEPDKASTLKKKIRQLAKNQGDNVRLYKQQDGYIEAVFSREPGFLLGETIWIFFNKPNNLIYCEALPERRQVLLVVVINGVVFLDAKRNFANIIDELVSLATNNEKFDIYICGDVPIGKTSESGKFVFDEKNISSFKELKEPLLQQLPIDENAQLQPLELALSSSILGKTKILPTIVIAAIVAGIIIAYHIIIEPPQIPKLQLMRSKVGINLYGSFYNALTTPSPNKQIAELVSTTDLAMSLPGWKASTIKYDGDNYTIQLKQVGGSITQAQKWAKLNELSISLQQNGMNLMVPSKLINRPKPDAIYPFEQTLALLLDDLQQVVPGKNVRFSNISSYGSYKSANILINVTKIFPVALMLIGEELSRFPVTINSISLTVNDGLFTGKISLKVLGD